MSQSKPSSLVANLTLGLSVSWLGVGQTLAHSGEVAPHPHRDWRPLFIVALCLLVLLGSLAAWRYRCWIRRRQQPEAFVPPPVGLPASDEGDDQS